MHPAEHNLLATLSFNIEQLDDLIDICDAATELCTANNELELARRTQDYRVIFNLRAQELRVQLIREIITEP